MTVFRAYNASSLKTILQEVRSGDTITLASGDYGNIRMDGKKYGNLSAASEITIKSADASNQAIISGLRVENAKNITFENLTFARDYADSKYETFHVGRSQNVDFENIHFVGKMKGGYGNGVGLNVSGSRGVDIVGSEFDDLAVGLRIVNSRDVRVERNDFDDISEDGMRLSHAHDVDILSNRVEMHTSRTKAHKDGLQVVNKGGGDAASGLMIKDNVFITNDKSSHGIYMGNYDARNRDANDHRYEDITITGNTVVAGHKLALAVGAADGLKIINNTVLQGDWVKGGREINTPHIMVSEYSKNVQIIGNKTHEIDSADGGWRAVGHGEKSWQISNNKLVSTDGKVTVTPSPTRTPDKSSDTSSSPGKSTDGDVTTLKAGSGADHFRVSARKLDGDTKTVVKGIDFDDDTFVFIHFDHNTFQDVSGGNRVDNSRKGDYVKINDLVDLMELDHASDDIVIKANKSDDTLTMTIKHDGDSHQYVFEGLGRDYLNKYDADLF